MHYPKPIMSITEMVALGFSKYELTCDCRAKSQDFAVRTPGGKKWRIDTEKYEKWRNEHKPH